MNILYSDIFVVMRETRIILFRTIMYIFHLGFILIHILNCRGILRISDPQ